MAEIKKITKKESFSMIKEILIENERPDLAKVMEREIELLNKKSSRTAPTKTQVENEKIKEKIVATLVELDKYATITDIQNANIELADLSNQKISALLKQLVNTESVIRIVDKKKAYFKASV